MIAHNRWLAALLLSLAAYQACRDASAAEEAPAPAVFRVQIRLGRAVSSLAFSPDGKTPASGSTHGTIKLWNIRPQK